jgi:glyoxylase I family protein
MENTLQASAPGTTTEPPALAALHHIGITVTDQKRSVEWYGEMLGMVQWGEERYPGGSTALLMRPGTHVHLGLDSHEANGGESFAPHRTGLDHLAFMIVTRGELEAWHSYLTGRGVECSDVRDVVIESVSASMFTFTDPDGVALEMMYMDATE